ncbi:hypothetical protein SJ05684_c01820 [Sinorhizobium sojae CCBAU 05684]|uniref:Uncharacterized protein n=1 Tax=Sinorhizobium sojae CCBAU 05684 TaxID=716928 RepID=A0A249P7D9_9HYPH|nr:hypothetical protein [Sinorhizobium sojae]ASY61652.1 hypothetical protein SJ05684_c01820 [Sinorhizobium sojae CCBAU 05684]
MNKQVIEHDGVPVGVIVPDEDQVKFLAVKYQVWDLDARRFRSAEEARAAIRHLLAGKAPLVRQGGAAAA